MSPNSAVPTTDKPLRPRRWTPLSLRLFVAMLLVAGIGSALWFGVPAYWQLQAIREIERLGGRFYSEPVGPLWLRARASDEIMKAFDEVVSVKLDGTEATDDTLRQLCALRKLQSLSLGNTRVTDSGLAQLKSLTSLKGLGPLSTQVTDNGLANIKGLSNLTALWLDDTQVTDAGLVHLTSLTNLRQLDLGSTRITDAGLPQLKRLTGLYILTLTDTPVTEAGIGELQRALPSLATRARTPPQLRYYRLAN